MSGSQVIYVRDIPMMWHLIIKIWPFYPHQWEEGQTKAGETNPSYWRTPPEKQMLILYRDNPAEEKSPRRDRNLLRHGKPRRRPLTGMHRQEKWEKAQETGILPAAPPPSSPPLLISTWPDLSLGDQVRWPMHGLLILWPRRVLLSYPFYKELR